MLWKRWTRAFAPSLTKGLAPQLRNSSDVALPTELDFIPDIINCKDQSAALNLGRKFTGIIQWHSAQMTAQMKQLTEEKAAELKRLNDARASEKSAEVQARFDLDCRTAYLKLTTTNLMSRYLLEKFFREVGDLPNTDQNYVKALQNLPNKNLSTQERFKMTDMDLFIRNPGVWAAVQSALQVDPNLKYPVLDGQSLLYGVLADQIHFPALPAFFLGKDVDKDLAGFWTELARRFHQVQEIVPSDLAAMGQINATPPASAPTAGI